MRARLPASSDDPTSCRNRAFRSSRILRLSVPSGAGLILDLVREHRLRAGGIEAIEVGTNSNVPNALIYPMPKTALEGKFRSPFCMAIAVLERKRASPSSSIETLATARASMMKRVPLYVDDELETLGYDQVRSRLRSSSRAGR